MVSGRNLFVATAFAFIANQSSICNAQLLPGDPTYQDYYCGWDWEEAHDFCEFHCPSGLDIDCPPLPNGRKRRCIAAAGCFERFTKVYWTGVISLSFDKEEHMAASNTTGEAGTTEDGGLISKEDEEVFEKTFSQWLFEALQEQLLISGVTIQEQEYDNPCISAASGNDSDDSTSLDMVIRFVGEYIPVAGKQAFTDDTFGEEVLASIQSNPEGFVNALKNSSIPIFDALVGVSGIEEDDIVEPPTFSPSLSPTRGNEQVFNIRIDPRPTGSHGIVFNVRTPAGGGTILLTAMSFVTLHEGILEYQVYSKLGNFEKFIGKNSYWELVASGQTVGLGPKRYTRVNEEDTVISDGAGRSLSYKGFKPIHVPGDRGMRSFYIAITKRFMADDGQPIPLLFSYPVGNDAEGTKDYEIIDSTPELEVFEGVGSLDFPWDRDSDGPYYRRPRGFIGHFDYNRYPCYPQLNVTDWPCPYVPRTSPPTMKPSKMPTLLPVTQSPVTDRPTDNPTPPITTLTQNVTATDPSKTNVPDQETIGNETATTTEVKAKKPNKNRLKKKNNSWKVAYRSWGPWLATIFLMRYLW